MQEASDFRVCVIGLGSMGMGAAKACIAAGIETYGVDLRPAICAELLEAGAKETGSNARSLAGRLDAVVVLVDRKRVREGKRGSVRVGTGGRRDFKKKKKKK